VAELAPAPNLVVNAVYPIEHPGLQLEEPLAQLAA